MMYKQNALLAALLVALQLAAAPVQAADEQVLTKDGISFVSGGVGDDSADRMAAVGKEFNLKLLFAAVDGHFLADVAVNIVDERGMRVLETTSGGPFLFVRLAPGKYLVTAAYAGEATTRSTVVSKSGQRELVFRWPERGDWPTQ